MPLSKKSVDEIAEAFIEMQNVGYIQEWIFPYLVASGAYDKKDIDTFRHNNKIHQARLAREDARAAAAAAAAQVLARGRAAVPH